MTILSKIINIWVIIVVIKPSKASASAASNVGVTFFWAGGHE